MFSRFLGHLFSFGSLAFCAYLGLMLYSVNAAGFWTLTADVYVKLILFCLTPSLLFAISKTLASLEPQNRFVDLISTGLPIVGFLFFLPGTVIFNSLVIEGKSLSASDFVFAAFLLVLGLSFFYAGRWYIRKFQSTDFEKD